MVLEELSHNLFSLPPSTQVTVEYTNLKECPQHAKSNFKPTKRTFKRVPSAQENACALRKTLKNYWGFDNFRDRQLEICVEVVKGNDVFVNAPTGLGKSVCFQVPAVTIEHGITIVIVPIIALMHDQVSSLQERGIQAASLCSTTPPSAVAEIKRQLVMNHPHLRLLYTTPETLFGARYEQYFQKCYQQKQLVRMVIDEAHVIDDWGWAFRPEFRQLGRFREKFPEVPISAFTASARSETREHICRVLGIKKNQYAQFVFPINRKNLFYEVKHRGPEEDEDKVQDVIETITRVQKETRQRDRPVGVGIVYCSYVETCKFVCNQLRKSGIKADLYHAKMSDIEKEQVQEGWKAGRIQCIVATIAFGMGIDKSDVRYVIHFQCPSGIEPYYQETGRAGRDGHMARCIFYYSREDAGNRRSMVNKTAKEAMTKCEAKGEKEQGEDFARRYTNSFRSLQHFAESIEECRHVALARYFEESNIDTKKAEHLEAYCNKMCDICVNRAAVARRATNVTEDVPIASQCVPAPPRPETEAEAEAEAEIEGHEASDTTFPSSLAIVHGSDSGPSSTAGPSAQRTSFRLPPVGLASATSSFVPSPIGRQRVNLIPVTPAPLADRKGKRAIAISEYAEGSYAVPDEPPSSKKKRKQQHDSFMATEPVHGEGPYGYYGASSTGASSSRPRSQIRPMTFKTPFRKEREHLSKISITADRRGEALTQIADGLKGCMVSGDLADRVWSYWGRPQMESRGVRRKIINTVAQAYEAELVESSNNLSEYNKHLAFLEKVLRMLSMDKGVDALTSGDLAADHGDREEIRILLDLGQRIGAFGGA